MKHFILAVCALFGLAVFATQPVGAATSMDSHNIFEIYDDTGSGGGTGGTGGSGGGDTAGTGQQTSTGSQATPSNLATRSARGQSGTGAQRMGVGSWINQKSGDRLPALNGLSDFWLLLFGIQIMVIVALSTAIIWQHRRARVAVVSNE
ncbi:hypothetical protein [Loigolactobacillus zhaoyuanensis]|uniref:Uncharacterized protein n=1 Tax=Loigolactobacillus zhaoyuanensis TaxID=2486017 RepID=A0ABW8U9U7_9LACO|nr:hypothetical protein [Loigolactobacillus zhaoyuanensis]